MTDESQAAAKDAADALRRTGAQERRDITRNAGIVAAGTLTSRLLGLGREQVLAGMFSRAQTDIFFFAFIIPNLLRQLLAEGAVQNAVMPVLAQTKQREGEARARELFRALRGLSLSLLLLVTLLGVVGAPWLVQLVAAGYATDASEFEHTVKLTRWLFPYILLIGTAALGVAALNTHGRFVVTSFAPGLLNVSFIVCALVLPGWAIAEGADPLAALAIGVIVGGVLQVVAQWPSLHKIGYFSAPRLDLGDPGVREVLRRMTPVLAGVGIYYIDVVVGRRILSHLETGSVSYFTFAMRLCDFPQGIFVMALQAATLPSLSKLAAFDDRGELQKTFAYGLRLSLFVSLAATAMFVFLAEPIVVTVFQRGEFSAHDAHETARALVAQGSGIWLVACTRQLVALYYALGDTRTPVIVAAADFVVFVVAANLLGDYLGHVGVSWAVSLASLTQMSLLGLALRRHVKFRERTGVLRTFTTTLLASLPAGGAGVWLARQLVELGATGPLGGLAPGIAGVAAFGLVFVAAAWALGNGELRGLVEAVRQRRQRQA